MKNNRIFCLVLQALTIFSISTLAIADVIQLDEGFPQDCNKFKQPKTVIVVHAKGCPWSKGYMDNAVSPLSIKPEYQSWHFYELPFSLDRSQQNKTLCGKVINNCPVTFIKNENGQDSEPMHGSFALAELEDVLKKAGSISS